MSQLKQITAVLCLAALLTGCGPVRAPEAMNTEFHESGQETNKYPVESTQRPDSSPEMIPEDTAQAPALEETLPDTLEAEINLEGTEETMVLKRWDRQDYVIYFPENQWFLESLEKDGFSLDRWESIYNPLVTLTVVHLGDGDRETAMGCLMEWEPSVTFDPWEENHCFGRDLSGLRYLDVALMTSPGQNYLLVAKYPMEAIEGFGVRLRPVMESFQIR